jgi:hypothetical protein
MGPVGVLTATAAFDCRNVLSPIYTLQIGPLTPLYYRLSAIVVAGDFNSLDTEFLASDYGFTQIVPGPTHGNNLIDKFFVT